MKTVIKIKTMCETPVELLQVKKETMLFEMPNIVEVQQWATEGYFDGVIKSITFYQQTIEIEVPISQVEYINAVE